MTKIKTITANWVHVPIPESGRHRSDFGTAKSFDSTLIRIETDDGIVGHGEAKEQVGSASNNQAMCALIEKELTPELIGEDARDL